MTRNEEVGPTWMRRWRLGLTAAVGVAVAAAGAMFFALPAGAAAGPIRGLDVSHHQADRAPIDWARVKANGQSFVFVKATEGQTFTDPKYAVNYAGVRAAGMFRGAYHFASPDTTPDDAVKEARHFVNVAGRFNSPGELPPVLDMERDGKLSTSALVAWTNAFLRETERLTGRVPIIYTGLAFWRSELGNSRAFTRYPLWIAHYTSGSPSIPGGWSTYTFWQNTSSYRIPGISGNVDHNVFNGTAADLVTLAGGGGGTPTNPYQPEEVCGSGYEVIDQQTLTANGATQGTVYLLFNSANGNNCVVTTKATQLGSASPVSAHLEVQGRPRATDSGLFSYYAGPVRAGAANQCVRWGGSVGSATYNSSFEHCG